MSLSWMTYATCAGGGEDGEAKAPKPTLSSSAREVAVELPYVVKLLLSIPQIGTYLMKPPEPESIKDTRVLDPESNPYRMIECEIGKLWIVEYISSPDPGFADLIVGGFASAELRKKIIEGCKNDEERKVAEIDVEKCAQCDALSSSEIKKGAYLKHGLAMANYMIVARCPEDEKVVLYSPVQIDKSILGPWLEKIAPNGIKAIISSSIAHTMFVKSAKLAYPEALVIASDVAAQKLAHISVSTDCCYSDSEGLAAAKRALGSAFELITLPGDPIQELDLIYIPTKTLITSDLFYGKKL
uniref:Uncharacterized protein n=1 Tax=Aureoumbra lagunensis TaxID=44058 RepID=A0A7S3K443_9STRA